MNQPTNENEKSFSSNRVNPDLSVVVPVFNEAADIGARGRQLVDYCGAHYSCFEVIFVNDGSRDNSLKELQQLQSIHPDIRIISYSPNRGIGYALRQGFYAARGDFVVSIDADLSYAPTHIGAMLAELREFPSLDVVVGSAYMHGGSNANVPFWRLWLSRFGNIILSHALKKRVHTVTCILRAYRASFIKRLSLFSDSKEIHLEILEKAIALGGGIKEIPAHLIWEKKQKRRRGGFRLGSVITSHILFSFSERPMILFGIMGALFLLIGLACGGYIIYLWQLGQLTPGRPLFTVMLLLILTGIQIVLFGFLGIEISNIRRELMRLQIRKTDPHE